MHRWLVFVFAVELGRQHPIGLLLLLLKPLDFTFDPTVLLFYLLVLLSVVDQLFHEEIVIIFLARVLNLELGLPLFKLLMQLVEFLSAVSHVLELLVEGFLALVRVLVALLLLLRVRHQLFLVLCELSVQDFEEFVALLLEACLCQLFQSCDLLLESVELVP